jgi:hypothetical protein
MATLNQTIGYGLDASRPAASEPGRLYIASDIAVIYRDNGTSWNARSVAGVLHGSGAPSGGIGLENEFYIDTTNHDLYGPKTSGAWGSATSLIGPAGGVAPLTTKGDILGYDTASTASRSVRTAKS